MPKCCVALCKNAIGKIEGVSLFSFPKNPELRRKWLEAVKIDSQTIGENTRVCSLHFEESDIFHFSTKSKVKPGRVPHINVELGSENIDETNETSNETSNRKTVGNRLLNVKRKKIAIRRRMNIKKKNYNTPFLIENFINRDKKIMHYTGLPSFQILSTLYNYIFKSESGPPGVLQQSKSKNSKIGRPHQLTPLNELFLTLMKLRQGYDHETLSDMFGINTGSISRIFTTWINLLYLKLGKLNTFPHRDTLIKNSTVEFSEKYPNVIGSIDCTEFYIETPSSLLRQSQCFSHYKGSNTLKSLIMIDSNGGFMFISALYTGSITDKQIVQESGFIRLLRTKVEKEELKTGDIVLADKGFDVKDLLRDVGVELNIPTFRITGMQFRPDEVEYMRTISHERIHVERAIRRLKSFKILSHRIPISLIGSINQIYTVCALLSNCRYPLCKAK